MIANSTLTSINAARASDGNGAELLGLTTPLNGVRCMVEGPSEAHVRAAAADNAQVEAMLYVLDPLPGNVAPEKDGDVDYTLRGVAQSMAIVKVSRLIHGGLSHWQLWLKKR